MTYDAVIVGYGPVGATAAALLGKAGLRVAVVEQETGIYDRPRAITFDHEVMRVFQACGLSEPMREFTAPHPGTHYVGVDGKVHQDIRSAAAAASARLAADRDVRAAADSRRRCARGSISSRRSMFSQAINSSISKSATAASKRKRAISRPMRSRELRARYLLGCDGANSFVRKRLGIAYEDLAFDEWWMVVDVLLHETGRAASQVHRSIAGRSGRRPMSSVRATCAAGRSRSSRARTRSSSATATTW